MIWLANALTLARLPLAGLFWLVAPDRAAAVAVLAAAGLTDLLDGRVARYARRRRGGDHGDGIGGWLDPLCDKLFAVAVLVALAVRLDVPLGVLALIGARELVLAPLVAIYRVTSLRDRHPVALRADRTGKVATAAQFLALGAVVMDVHGAAIVAAAAALLGLGAVAHYLIAATRARPVAVGEARGADSARVGP